MKQVALVIPVFNEEGNIGVLVEAIKMALSGLPYQHTLLFVDDGSKDKTLNNIRELALSNSNIKYLSFSRNFGHQNALKAGLDLTDADCVISLDGDMQHPPGLIPAMLKKWEEGYDVVYTIRKEDKKLTYFKRTTSNAFYKLINRLSDFEIEKGTADFRLISKPVLNVLKGLNEYDLFFRGLIKWMGFKQVAIEYEPAERLAGASKYTFKRMVSFALNGITSFSTRPLYAAAYLGFIISLLSVLYVPYVLISYYFGYTISGWASVMVTIAFFGGLQLTILGIIGIYLGKLFMQSKNRPLYIIQETNLYDNNQGHSTIKL